jgi:hypothetical protein
MLAYLDSYAETGGKSTIPNMKTKQNKDTPGGINARLQKLGLIPDSQNTSQTRMKLRA